MYNLFLPSDFQDVKEVKSIDVILEDNSLVFTARIVMSYDYEARIYKIGQYNLESGYGSLKTKKGTKEYINLKSLYNAIYKVFSPILGIDYNKVLELKKQFTTTETIKESKAEVVKIETVETTNTEKCNTIYSVSQLINEVGAEVTDANINIANTIISMYNQANNFYQNDMIDCMKQFITNGTLDFSRYNLQFRSI